MGVELRRSVLVERNAGIPALLRTPVDEAVLADIQVAGARTTVPVVRSALDQVALKDAVVGVGVEAAAERRTFTKAG